LARKIVVSCGVAPMSGAPLADIGGSKSRFALAGVAGWPERILIIDNDTVADLDAAVARYLEETGARPRAASIAVAGPVGGEEIALTNRAWRLRRGEFAARLGGAQLSVGDHFDAVARAPPRPRGPPTPA